VPEGSRSKSTLWREAKALVEADLAGPGLWRDPLVVIELGMAMMMGLAEVYRKENKPDESLRYLKEATRMAASAMPYRHPRLSAVKNLGGDNELLEGVPADATPDELRAILAQRIAKLRDGGYFNLDALPPPEPAASS
jgi:hypothetical protein